MLSLLVLVGFMPSANSADNCPAGSHAVDAPADCQLCLNDHDANTGTIVANTVASRRYPAPGAHQRGHWTDGYYHRRTVGKWRVTQEDGSVESGQWAKGNPVGRWTVTAPATPARRSCARGGLPNA